MNLNKIKNLLIPTALTLSLTGCTAIAVVDGVVGTGVKVATTGVKVAATGVELAATGVKAIATDDEDDKDKDDKK